MVVVQVGSNVPNLTRGVGNIMGRTKTLVEVLTHEQGSGSRPDNQEPRGLGRLGAVSYLCLCSTSRL
jgi:hypothetical protein